MKPLFHNEWERLWSKKSSFLFLLFIPFIVFVTAIQSLEKNENLGKMDPQYSFWSNFPVMSLSEVFMLYFNIVAVLLVVMSFTHEYRTGQLRMVLQRGYSFSKVFLAKYIVVLLYLFVLLAFYFVCSLVTGLIFFEGEKEVQLFFRPEPVTQIKSLTYSVDYYLLSFLSLAAVASMAIFVGVVSKSSTSAFAITAIFLLVSMFYPVILGMFGGAIGYSQYIYFSLIEIQFSGVFQMLTHNLFLRRWIVSILAIYIVLGTSVSLVVFSKRDSLH